MPPSNEQHLGYMKTLSNLRWSPSPLIKAALLLYACDIFATVLRPESWPWTLGVFIVSYGILSGIGLWPRSTLLGQNWTRLPDESARRGEVAITIDDGPNPAVTPQVLDILERHGAKATFFCIGELAEQYPDLCREIVRRGHAVENHSQKHHYLFSLFGPRRSYLEIKSAQTTLSKITGKRPRFFRPTAGLRNPLLDPILAYSGLHLVSWTRRGYDTQESDADLVLQRLTQELRGGDILLLHDGNCAKTTSGTPVILEVLPRLLERIAKAELRPITLDSLHI